MERECKPISAPEWGWMQHECYFCHRVDGLQVHHVFSNAYRKKSERYGFLVSLCIDCHLGRHGVHQDWAKNLELKQTAQRNFEVTHTRDEFRAEFGKSYL